VNAATNLCSETAKQKSPPAETRPWIEPEKRLGDVPQYPSDHFARWIFPGATVSLNVQHLKNH